MELTILNEQFYPIYKVDVFESVIWTERYSSYGDFELYLPLNFEILNFARLDYYVSIPDSDRLMIIEVIEIETNYEEGNKIKISGRSLESLLDRRIIWNQTVLKGNVQGAVEKLLNENLIKPAMETRKIGNFVFVTNSNFEASKEYDATIDEEDSEEYEITAQYTGDNLYDAICEICTAFNAGFKVTFNSSNKTFEFQIYHGTDRTFANNPNKKFVSFSPNRDNLLSSNYIDNKTNLKNVTLIAGEDPEEGSVSASTGYDRVRVAIGEASGLERRELYTDARDIRSKLDDGTEIEAKPYRDMLRKRGEEKLAECIESIAFEGEIDTYHYYICNIDYFVGDIVDIKNELGIGARVRITEMIRSQDKEGYKIYPTFETV